MNGSSERTRKTWFGSSSGNSKAFIRIMRKLGFLLVAVSALSFALASAADLTPLAAKAKEEREVVWYTTTSAGDNQAVVAGFTRKYPFIKVQVLRMTGEKLRQRVLTETSAGQFFSDVLSVSGL